MNFLRAGALAVLAVAALAIAIPAFAQSEEPADETDKVHILGDFASRLAEELGIGEQRVEDALEQIHDDMRADFEKQRLELLKDRLDAAVEDGDLTRAQADAILEAHEKGVLGAPGFHGLGGPRHGPLGFGFRGHVMPAPLPKGDTNDGQVQPAPESSDPQAEDSTFVIPPGDVNDL